MKTLKGDVATSPDDAVRVAKEMGGSVWVVKAQVHAGGRGKAGGVKVAKSIDDVKALTKQIIGMNLVSNQTGPAGKKVHQVLIEQGCEIEKEYYVACLLDRAVGKVVIMASSEGGMDIEEVAHSKPESIHKVFVDPAVGLQSFQARDLFFALNMPAETLNQMVSTLLGLYQCYMTTDATMVEINPLVLTKQKQVLALDAKMNFDDNALFRQKEIVLYRDLREEEPTEIEASKSDLAFIKLDGNIGCLVNGAGLAMATLDIIQLHGGTPANFLDVGGGANKEKVAAAFRIILQDKNVKGILVNIFGGIMKCDVIAQGVIEASKAIGLKVPLVVRLQGTNVELGKKLLSESGLQITSADDLGTAAQKIVQAVKG